ncbi:tol-pal system protein YbgF [Mesorhizobium sp. NBSH29]|uniref:tol-pal system protein YbgF n=1 Tax=Mesorhizobium sp. NBSH29 TaxID=2654249 RepID=UPI001896497A|nr:tol-pal system protein YbgF [Mesorhizobium sp. NBSH29]QPC85783.1 tol-pal system protein YbgF [Mesorhizobium sp. NBSH29]
MKFRSVLGGMIALPLLYGVAFASPNASNQQNGIQLPGVFLPLPKAWTAERKPAGAPVQLAQAGDPRVLELEEQIRNLTGTVEELNFQVLQMQEQIRKIQADNEFRFQELEGKRTDAGGKTPRKAAEAPATETAAPELGAVAAVEPGAGAPQPTTGATLGTPEQTFGTIVFDESGNVTGGSVGDQATVGSAPMDDHGPVAGGDGVITPSGDLQVAALPSTNDPKEIYRNSYQFIMSGDYGTAETGFRDHIARFPSDPQAADAHFWLGESLLAQKKYRDAAEIFLAASKQYPKAKKAPDMMFKLGVSLAGLNQKDVACATFSEVGKRYPGISAAFKESVKQEQVRAAC